MAPQPQSAVYDDYLETKLRAVLEALVEALLSEQPKDINAFVSQWLTDYHRASDPSRDEMPRLEAERLALTFRRDGLLTQVREANARAEAAKAEAAAVLGAVKASKASASSSSKVPDAAANTAAAEAGFVEGGFQRMSSFSVAEEAMEQEKIQSIKGKDRRAGVSAQSMTEERMANWKRPFHEKLQEDREKIKKTIDLNDKLQVLFGHLEEEKIFSVIDAMFPKEVQPGENVITQGEEGDNFYIVTEGTFDVFVQRGDSEPGKVCEYGPGGMFGELALMYNAQRAATVTASSEAKLWALDRESFQMMLTTAENTKSKQYEGFLESVDLLQELTKYELSRLSDMLESQLFDKDEVIITQGEAGNYFYILEDGEAKAFIAGEQGEIEVKHYGKPGEYFGEIALLASTTRRATIRATGQGCTVLSVSRDDFDGVLGPIKDLLSKNIDKYPQYADFIKNEEERAQGEAKEQEKIQHIKDSSRRQGISAPPISDKEREAWTAPFYEKSSEAKERIKSIIDKNEKLQVLFGHLTDDAVLKVIDAMSSQDVEDGEDLITQGQRGDNFYVVDEGTFDVDVRRRQYSKVPPSTMPVETPRDPPVKVLDYGAGAMFGELALMYDAPRAATVRATSAAKVWALDRLSFQMMLTTAENTKKAVYEEFLSNIEIFKCLSQYELTQLSDMLTTDCFDNGEEIVKQGDEAKLFYIVEDGEAKAYIDGDQGEVEVKHYSAPGEYFGEVALITEGIRRATVRACGTGCSVLSASREDFDRVLGPIKDILKANVDEYPAYADYLQKG